LHTHSDRPPPNADITTIVVAGHMSSNVPPYRVDLIVAAAVGHSVFSSIGSILDIDGHRDGRHGYSPRKCKHQSIQEIYYCLGHHYFHCAF
jgi:hypothetical protein